MRRARLLLFLTAVEGNLQAGRPTDALAAARQLQDLGRRLDEPDMVTMGIHAEGRALIKAGQTADGLALVDEAMVAVLDGRLTPFTLRHPLLPHDRGLSRSGRPPADDQLDGPDREMVGARSPRRCRSGVRSAACAPCTGPNSTCSAAHGTRQSGPPCRSWSTSTPAGSTTPPRPGMSSQSHADCAATRTPPRPTTRHTPADATRNRDGRCCGSPTATPRAPPGRFARPLPRQEPIRCGVLPLCAAAVETAIAAGRQQDADSAAAELEETASTYRHVGAGGDGGHRARRRAAGGRPCRGGPARAP